MHAPVTAVVLAAGLSSRFGGAQAAGVVRRTAGPAARARHAGIGRTSATWWSSSAPTRRRSRQGIAWRGERRVATLDPGMACRRRCASAWPPSLRRVGRRPHRPRRPADPRGRRHRRASWRPIQPALRSPSCRTTQRAAAPIRCCCVDPDSRSPNVPRRRPGPRPHPGRAARRRARRPARRRAGRRYAR